MLWAFAILIPPAFAQDDSELVRSAVRSVGIEVYLQEMARIGSLKMPYMVDSETQAAAAVAVGRHLQNQWVFVKRAKADLDVSRLRDLLTGQGLSRVCTNPGTAILVNEFGATLDHSYSDRNGIFLFGFKANRSTCGPFAN